MWLRRQLNIFTHMGEMPKRVLMEFELSSVPIMPKVDDLSVYDTGGEYSDKYRQLTAEYYLKF
jgi:tRNA1(Val) A37 N6-methylase TrmN6